MLMNILVYSNPPKGTSSVLVDSVNTEELVSALNSYGYVVSYSENGVVKTEVRQIKIGGIVHQVDLVCNKSKEGFILVPYVTIMGSRIQSKNVGMKKSANRTAWNDIEQIIKILKKPTEYNYES